MKTFPSLPNFATCLLAMAFLFALPSTAKAQAILDLESTTEGVLIPRMTQAERDAITSPPTSLLLYQTDGTPGYHYFDGTAWVPIGMANATAAVLADADADTKVQVEKNADEDIVRLDLGGSERLVLKQNANGSTQLALPNNHDNTFVGEAAGDDNAPDAGAGEGVDNTFVGKGAGTNNSSGSANTLIGSNTGGLLATGSENTFVGTAAGINNTAGSGNVMLGYQAGENEAGSDKLYIDNSGTAAPLLYGEFDNDLLRVNGTLNVNSAFSFPTADGASGQVLRTDGSGVLTWQTPTVGSGDDLGNHTATQAIDMAGQAVNNVLDPTAAQDAATKGYVDAQVAGAGDDLGSHLAAQHLDMAGKAVFNVQDPIVPQDAATKNYVDAQVAGVSLTEVKDADSDTKIQVEEGADDDIIRFDLEGEERLVMKKNANGSTLLETLNNGNNVFIGEGAGAVNNVTGAGDEGKSNVFLGWLTGNKNTTGAYNMFLGAAAGFSNTTGGSNVFIGDGAGFSNTTGTDNVFVGRRGGFYVTTGSGNTANGQDALYSNTTGSSNTATGANALRSNTIGGDNTATGRGALFSNTSGDDNTAAGRGALYSNTIGVANTATGANALGSNTIGANNTATGWGALFSNTSGVANTAAGRAALYSNTTGTGNTANGFETLCSNTIGVNNTATGRGALYSNTSGVANTAAGRDALHSNTTGAANTATGVNALYSNTIGSSNTAAGWSALGLNTIGSSNTATGRDALYSNTSGSSNTATGRGALLDNTTGNENTATGRGALLANTTGGDNTATGANALRFNTTGGDNTATGRDALYANTTGAENTALGEGALYFNTTGEKNTATGRSALRFTTTGDNNTGIGYAANVVNGGLGNATAIGAVAMVNASDKVRIGNASVTVIEGQVDWTFPSDARFKFNVEDGTVPGLAFIGKLRPVTYQFDTRKFDRHLMQHMPDSLKQERLRADYSKSTAIVQTGFLAQEVEQVCKELDYSFSGLHVPTSDVDNYGLAYGSFVPLLVKAVQELNEEVEGQQGIIDAQRAENAALKAQLETQAAQLDKISAALRGAGIAVEK